MYDGKKTEAISSYKLSKKENGFCIAVLFSCAVVYGLALLGIDYPPLTKTVGWLAFSVAVAINSLIWRYDALVIINIYLVDNGEKR